MNPSGDHDGGRRALVPGVPQGGRPPQRRVRVPRRRPAPMPWSVFFADGGIAFHGGDRDRASAGCVKLVLNQARAFYADLQVGDQVQVLNASTERAERAKLAAT
ncbi:L,D-transpeptidase [Pseudonocardia sp. NPDC046786]|uniref:L,D-transpeptidase n=1 Tax=Pseudonocardia sp. NPDC046786 TaxID=3155471 RepID=UPI0033C2B5B2